MGIAGAYGRGRSGPPRSPEGHSLSDGDPGRERDLARRTPQCPRFPARFLSHLSWLWEIFSSLGACALPQSDGREPRACDARHVEIVLCVPHSSKQDLNGLGLSLLVLGTKFLYTPLLGNEVRCGTTK